MSDGLDSIAGGGRIYHSPVAACGVTYMGQSYGFHLGSNHTHWVHYDSDTHGVDKCVTVDLHDIFHGTTKCAEIESNVDDGNSTHRYFVPIHRGCTPGTKLLFPAAERDNTADALFTLFDQFKDDGRASVFRHGPDVYMRFTIDLKMALCGFKLQVNAIDGSILKFHINDVVTPDYIKVVPNEGLPVRQKPAERGNLYLCFKIEFPKTLSKHSKQSIAHAMDGVSFAMISNGWIKFCRNLQPFQCAIRSLNVKWIFQGRSEWKWVRTQKVHAAAMKNKIQHTWMLQWYFWLQIINKVRCETKMGKSECGQRQAVNVREIAKHWLTSISIGFLEDVPQRSHRRQRQLYLIRVLSVDSCRLKDSAITETSERMNWNTRQEFETSKTI